jgi:hypothetical protein
MLDRLGSLFETSPFHIAELKNSSIEKEIKATVFSDHAREVPPNHLQGLVGQGVTLRTCASVFTHLFHAIDDCGSHPSPVYKSLMILIHCLLSPHSEEFIIVGQLLIPEIQTIMYLSFDDKSSPFRDRIHAMADAIYRFLIFGDKLPSPEEFGLNWSKIKHRIAPPPLVYPGFKPPKFGGVSILTPPAAELEVEDDSEELSFDPRKLERKLSNQDSWDLIQQGPASPVQTASVVEDETEPEPEPKQPVREEPVVKTVNDLLGITDLQLLTAFCFDDTFDAC